MTRSLSQIRQDSRDALAGNYMVYFIVLLVTGLLTTFANQILSFLTLPLGPMPIAVVLILDLFLSFLLTILAKMLQAGQYFLSLNIARYNRVSVSDLFLAFRYDSGKAFKLSAILSLIDTLCTAPLMVAFSYLLYSGALVISFSQEIPVQKICLYLLSGFAGMIVLEILVVFPFSQALYLYIDHQEYSAAECISKSFALMRGHKLDYLKMHLSLIGYFALCILSLGLGIFWVMPYMNVCRANFYMSVSGTYKPY